MPAPLDRIQRIAVLIALATIVSCSGPPAPAVVAPVAVDAAQVALSLEGKTALNEPLRVVFSWSLNESGVRVKGHGVARIEPPYKARLDLFMGNGETVVRAALIDGDLRLPPGSPTGILPPADLMWAVLGVFRPQTGSDLLGADRLDNGELQLRYRYPDGQELHVQVADGDVHSAQLEQGGHVVQRIEVGMATDSRVPAEAIYRNLAAFRELKLTRESVERVGSYPPGIWNPAKGDGGGR